MKNLPIPSTLLQEIYTQAEREYPRECSGMIFGPVDKAGELTKLRPCKNVQDDYHAKDPKNFPRTAQTAYFIDPKELLAIQKEVRQGRLAVRVIYHSHIDTGAYFSEEDKRIASPEEEPAYPGVEYLVVSVIRGKVADANLFRWNPAKKDFFNH